LILNLANEKQKPHFIIIADRIADPHNLGAIIRTANSAGADGVIISKHDSATLTPVCEKASAGAAQHTPVARVTNLAQTIEKLKEKGIWVIGADMYGENTIYTQDFSGNVAIVIDESTKIKNPVSKLTKDFFEISSHLYKIAFTYFVQ